MRSILIGLLAISAPCLHAESESQTSPLHLATSVTRAKYCAVDDAGATLELSLDLRYTNTGTEALLLWRRSNEVAGVFLSKTPADAEAKRYESTLSLHSIEGDWKIPEDGPGPEFLLVNAGSELRLKGLVQIFFRRPGGTPAGGPLIAPGKHVFQIRVFTWPGSDAALLELGERWRAKGRLLHERLISSPTEFTMDSCPWLVDCNIGVTGSVKMPPDGKVEGK